MIKNYFPMDTLDIWTLDIGFLHLLVFPAMLVIITLVIMKIKSIEEYEEMKTVMSNVQTSIV